MIFKLGLDMSLRLLVIVVVLTGLLSCVSQERVNNLYAELDGVDDCCSSFRDFEYKPLTLNGGNVITVTRRSSVYTINNNKSYVESFMLPHQNTGHIRFELPLAKLTGVNKSILSVQYLFLDKRFRVVLDTPGSIRKKRELNKFEWWSIYGDISVPSNALYLIVYTAPENTNSITLSYLDENRGFSIHGEVVHLNLFGKPTGKMSMFFE